MKSIRVASQAMALVALAVCTATGTGCYFKGATPAGPQKKQPDAANGNTALKSLDKSRAVSPMTLKYTDVASSYTVGAAIKISPPAVSGGTADAFSVNPPLPGWLTLDDTTGAITGDAHEPLMKASFNVTATNSSTGAQATTTIILYVISGAAQTFQYSTERLVLVDGANVETLTPDVSTGASFTFAIQPALPAELKFDQSDGTIEGTARGVSDPKTYSVTTDEASVPAANLKISVSTVSDISVGDTQVCVMLADGNISCWGSARQGQLGDGAGTSDILYSPRHVKRFEDDALKGAVQVASGGNHTCALTGTGQVLCWGSNSHRQLGSPSIRTTATPVVVPDLTGKSALTGVTQLALGFKHACALTSSGDVLCWGANVFGQLANETSMKNHTPAKVALGARAVRIFAGGDHSCAILADDSLRCWGLNASGELGSSTNMKTCHESSSGLKYACSAAPVEIRGLDGKILSLSIGFGHACAVVIGGSVKCWGSNVYGQLGDGSTNNSPTPVNVALNAKAVSVSVADSFSCARDATGAVWCWGANKKGQLGADSFPDKNCSLKPLKVNGLAGPASAISVGFDLACALVGGKTQCWGSNFLGRLGNGSSKSTSKTPVFTGPWR